jgi:hypothetical protein
MRTFQAELEEEMTADQAELQEEMRGAKKK